MLSMYSLIVAHLKSTTYKHSLFETKQGNSLWRKYDSLYSVMWPLQNWQHLGCCVCQIGHRQAFWTLDRQKRHKTSSVWTWKNRVSEVAKLKHGNEITTHKCYVCLFDCSHTCRVQKLQNCVSWRRCSVLRQALVLRWKVAHSFVAWMKENISTCGVVRGDEWTREGGLRAQLRWPGGWAGGRPAACGGDRGSWSSGARGPDWSLPLQNVHHRLLSLQMLRTHSRAQKLPVQPPNIT